MLNVYAKGNVVLDSSKIFSRSITQMLYNKSGRFTTLSLPYFEHSALLNPTPTRQNKNKSAPASMQSIYIIVSFKFN